MTEIGKDFTLGISPVRCKRCGSVPYVYAKVFVRGEHWQDKTMETIDLKATTSTIKENEITELYFVRCETIDCHNAAPDRRKRWDAVCEWNERNQNNGKS